MEVRIGVVESPREVEVDLPDDTDREALLAELDALLAKGAGVLWLTDRKGRRVGLAGGRVAWVQVGTVSTERRVGFGAS